MIASIFFIADEPLCHPASSVRIRLSQSLHTPEPGSVNSSGGRSRPFMTIRDGLEPPAVEDIARGVPVLVDHCAACRAAENQVAGRVPLFPATAPGTLLR